MVVFIINFTLYIPSTTLDAVSKAFMKRSKRFFLTSSNATFDFRVAVLAAVNSASILCNLLSTCLALSQMNGLRNIFKLKLFKYLLKLIAITRLEQHLMD